MKSNNCPVCGSKVPEKENTESTVIDKSIDELPDDWSCPDCHTDKISIELMYNKD